VLVTTTTKMYPPARNLLLLGSADKVPFYTHLTLGKSIDPESGKLLGVHPDEIPELKERFGAGCVLVEADGAAGRPVKAPAGHEPVIPASADLVIGVVGLDSLGRPADEDSVFRLECFLNVTGLALSDEIGLESLQALAAHPEGLFKGCPSGARKVVFYNKADAYEFVAGGSRDSEPDKTDARKLALGGGLASARDKADASEAAREVVYGSARQGWFMRRE
jgi:probable selenium-dependent hydroxylase accessory protein YqeC